MIHPTIDDWRPWFDRVGLLTNNTNKSGTGNGLMYTAEYLYWLSYAKPFGYQDEFKRIKRLYESCWVPNGGFKRAPSGHYSKHLNQNDDYFGIALASKILKADFSARCLDVMRRNHGALNNVKPGEWTFKSWIGRMPQVTVTLQLSAGERPSMWGLAFWLLWLFTSLTRRKRDSAIKGWLAGRSAYGNSKLLDNILTLFFKLFKKSHGGVGKREYFKLEHPVRKYMWSTA